MEGLCSMKQSVRLFLSAGCFFFLKTILLCFLTQHQPSSIPAKLQNSQNVHVHRHSNHNVRYRPQYYWAPHLLKKEGGGRFAILSCQLFIFGWLFIPVPGKLFACTVIFSNQYFYCFFLQKMDVWAESWWASSHHEILTLLMNQTCPGLSKR